MPFPAYSYRYYAGTVQTSAEVPLAPIPAGYRFVVNFISATSLNAASGILVVYLMPGRVELTRLVGAASGSVELWDGRLVLHEGENAQLRALTSNFGVSIAGWLLSGSGGPAFPATMPA